MGKLSSANWTSRLRVPGRLVACGLCASACTPNFDSASEVRDLRVLAVGADPPEAQVDLQTGEVPDVKVRVLFADPLRTGPATLDARVCFPTDNDRCGTSGLKLPTVIGKVGELALTLSVPAPLILGALQDDRLKGLGGIRVQLEAQVDDGDPAGGQYAVKLLLFSPKVAGYVPNHGLEIAGLDQKKDGAVVSTIAAGGSLNLKVGEEVGLRPLLAPAAGSDLAIEEYDTTDLKGNTVHLRETPSYAFYSTPGAEPDRDTTDELLPGVDEPPNGLFRFKALGPGQGKLWVVVRDGRGASAWLEVPWNATP